MRVSLADAARMTGRSVATIRRWIEHGVFEPGAALRTDGLAASVACSSDGSASTNSTNSMGARANEDKSKNRTGWGSWSIDVAVLERIHRQRGGMYWHPEVAERVRLPDYLARRLALIEHLENEVARLHRQVESLRGRSDARKRVLGSE